MVQQIMPKLPYPGVERLGDGSAFRVIEVPLCVPVPVETQLLLGDAVGLEHDLGLLLVAALAADRNRAHLERGLGELDGGEALDQLELVLKVLVGAGVHGPGDTKKRACHRGIKHAWRYQACMGVPSMHG